MSNLFDRLTPGAAKTERAPTQNIAVRIVGYDQTATPPVFKGTRMDTGEEVSVFLRDLPADTVKKLRQPRPELKDFDVPKGYYARKLAVCDTPEERRELLAGLKSKTEPGGIVVFDSVYPDATTGLLSARWANSASRYDGAASVGQAMVRVDPLVVRADESGEVKSVTQTITLADVANAQRVSSPQDLASVVADAFARGSSAAIMVRAESSGEVKVIEQDRGFKKGDDDKYAPRPVDEAVAFFLNSPNGKLLTDILKSPEGIKIEVVPLAKMVMGSYTKSVLQSKNKLGDFDKAFRLANGENGFTECLVTYRDSPGDGPGAFLDVKPITGRPTFVAASGLRTEAIALKDPSLAKPTPAAEADLAPPAASAGPADSIDLHDPALYSDDDDLPPPPPAQAAPTRTRGLSM